MLARHSGTLFGFGSPTFQGSKPKRVHYRKGISSILRLALELLVALIAHFVESELAGLGISVKTFFHSHDQVFSPAHLDDFRHFILISHGDYLPSFKYITLLK